MLRTEELSDAEKTLVRQELAEQRSERAKERENRLASVRLVGVTCAASSFPLLDDKTFDIGTLALPSSLCVAHNTRQFCWTNVRRSSSLYRSCRRVSDAAGCSAWATPCSYHQRFRTSLRVSLEFCMRRVANFCGLQAAATT